MLDVIVQYMSPVSQCEERDCCPYARDLVDDANGSYQGSVTTNRIRYLKAALLLSTVFHA